MAHTYTHVHIFMESKCACEPYPTAHRPPPITLRSCLLLNAFSMAFVIRNWLVIAIFSVMAVKNQALCITEKVSKAKPPTLTRTVKPTRTSGLFLLRLSVFISLKRKTGLHSLHSHEDRLQPLTSSLSSNLLAINHTLRQNICAKIHTFSEKSLKKSIKTQIHWPQEPVFRKLRLDNSFWARTKEGKKSVKRIFHTLHYSKRQPIKLSPLCFIFTYSKFFEVFSVKYAIKFSYGCFSL